FQPVYGVNRDTPVSVESRLGQVEISNIPDRAGQELRNALIDRFYRHGYPDNPRYALNIGDLRERLSKLDITKTSDATRGQLRMTAKMVLVDRANNQKILERELKATASYNIVGSEFANRITQEDARRNAIQDLARQAEMQLDLYLKRPPG